MTAWTLTQEEFLAKCSERQRQVFIDQLLALAVDMGERYFVMDDGRLVFEPFPLPGERRISRMCWDEDRHDWTEEN